MQLLCPVSAVLASEKKCKYLSANELHPASFTSFVVSVEGILGHETLIFLQDLADWLSGAWSGSYSHVLMWIKDILGFAVVQAVNFCFHGSSVHWQSGTSIDDEAGLPLFLILIWFCNLLAGS